MWLARAVAVLMIAALASACSSGGSAGGTAARSSFSPSASRTPAAERVDKRDGERVTAALLGESATEMLMEGLRPEDAQLPSGSGLTLDLNRAIVDGNLARVPATVTGPLAGSWTVLLTRIDGTWRIYGTVKP